jgi:hypothetical protein
VLAMESAVDQAKDRARGEVLDVMTPRPGARRHLARTWQFELPDVNLPSIGSTLRIRFPDLEWPELPNTSLHRLHLPRINLHDFQLQFPQFQWPAVPNLAFLTNLLRIAFPKLNWPDLPALDSLMTPFTLPEGSEWEWPDWELPDVNISHILRELRTRFPHLTWPDLPHIAFGALALPRLRLGEYDTEFPHLAPWPSVPDLFFFLNLLRLHFPELEWPDLPEWTVPQVSLPDLTLPDWSLPDWDLLEWDLTTSCIDGILVKLCAMAHLRMPAEAPCGLCNPSCAYGCYVWTFLAGAF